MRLAGVLILHPELANIVRRDQAEGFGTTLQDVTTNFTSRPLATSVCSSDLGYDLDVP